VYSENGDEAATLAVTLADEPSGLEVVLAYTVFAGRDVIARSARIVNAGRSPVTLRRALSASLDLPRHKLDFIRLPGAWARERWVERDRLHSGLQAIGSRRGASSHQDNPFFALVAPQATEEHGHAYGFSLVYSGNHFGGTDVDPFFQPRAFLGISPDLFAWRLEPGESFQTPEVVLAFSAGGLGGMSRQYHSLYRERLCRGRWRDAERPIVVNNWEATFFDFDAPKILAIAEVAKKIGVETLVLDDGWFGKRNDDKSSLGDWFLNQEKLPAGLADLARRVNALGLGFGLWFEPEMVSPDSRLYRAHPDWCLHIPGRNRSQSRNQLVLDFSRPEVVDAIYAQVAAILRDAPITYVKWDMNRHLSEVASAGREPARQAETFHRHILGVYAFMERITTEFPHILFESCSGGGGRYDPGMLFYMPQIWASDNTDPISRLKIQHGTSLVYPLSTLDAAIAVSPCHPFHRPATLKTRGHVALAGLFGFQLDLSTFTETEVAESIALTDLAKRTRRLRATGDLHRLRDPFTDNCGAWAIVAPDRGEAVITYVHKLAEAGLPPHRLSAGHPTFTHLAVPGLDPAATYRSVHGPAGEWSGAFLMHVGLPFELTTDFESVFWHLQRV
jgi:alpha-galactosidase